MRTIFGAQNVQVENPAWMSGGLTMIEDAVLPWNRIVIIGFAFAVLGLVLRAAQPHAARACSSAAVTQNRPMASAPGRADRRASTCSRSDSAPASPGSPAARCRRSATSAPTSGQSYIVDSFMVVVLGGVGQLAGTVVAGARAGRRQQVPRGLDRRGARPRSSCWSFIIVFIQKRPQGLFALKGRMADG